MSETILVKYTGNADNSNNTGAVTHRDGRPPLILGGAEGEITAEEFTTLSGRGLVLERVGDGYDDLSVAVIEQRLDEAGIDHKGVKKKDDLVGLLRTAPGAAVPPPAALEGATASGGTAGDATPGATGTAAGSASVGVGQTGGGAA